MIRVLIVDDHAVVRRGVVQIVAESPNMHCTGEASTGRHALQLARQNDYDVAVLDIHLPDGSGLDILKQLHALKPAMPILILSIYSEQQYATRAFGAGAAGYLTKDSVPEELITAIYAVAHGKKYVSSSMAERLAERMSPAAEQAPHELLSDREYHVLRLLAGGKTISDIAAELSLSVKTVSTYRTRILEKLGLTSTADIIRYALERGLGD